MCQVIGFAMSTSLDPNFANCYTYSNMSRALEGKGDSVR